VCSVVYSLATLSVRLRKSSCACLSWPVYLELRANGVTFERQTKCVAGY
jgi:hypothetical protein